MADHRIRLLFLLGGSAAFEAAAEAFVPAAGGAKAHIALLLAGGRGWQKHLPEYTAPWARRGIAHIEVIVPGADGELDREAAAACLQRASGIMIGGGHTPTYCRLYGQGPLAALLRMRYRAGVPIAGMSAGALLMPEVCAITPDDTGAAQAQIEPGLGLLSGVVMGVHFSERNALPYVLEAMAATRTPLAYGLDEAACAVFAEGRFQRALGSPVHEIAMGDFASGAYTMRTRRVAAGT